MPESESTASKIIYTILAIIGYAVAAFLATGLFVGLWPMLIPAAILFYLAGKARKRGLRRKKQPKTTAEPIYPTRPSADSIDLNTTAGEPPCNTQIASTPADDRTDGTPMQPDYIVLDLETTGLDPTTESIIDIGMVYVRGDKPIATYSQLVNPLMPIPAEITELTGINDAMVANQPPFSAIAADLHQQIGNLPILGHNIQFDIGFLNAAFHANNLPPLTNATNDTRDLSRDKYPTATSHTLQDVMRRVGIEKNETHRALADAEDTLECYKRLNALQEPQTVTPDDEQESARQRQNKTRRMFRSRHLASNAQGVKNSKPYGVVIPSAGGVEIIGEEDHQDKLSEYGPGAWFWVELQRGENPKGSHKGEPTILVTLDGEQIGWMTPTNTSRHYHQVPKLGGVALAHSKSGKSAAIKLDVRVEMPEAEPPSEEYKTALTESRLMSPSHPRAQLADPVHQGGRVKVDDAEVCMSTWGTANKMPHKKDVTGSTRTTITLNDNGAEVLTQYEDGTLLWATLRKAVDNAVQVKIGRKQIGTLDLTDNAAFLDLITDNGAVAKIEIGTHEGSRTATALLR